MGFYSEFFIFSLMFIFYYHDQMVITAQAQEPTPNYLAYNFCIDGNYTANSTYQTNLNLLLSSLSTTFTNKNTVPRYGYRNVTIGIGTDTVYGSLHCREDVTPDECSDCVQLATDEVVKDTDEGCPNSKGAIMFYNGCVLRYSDKYYFSMLNEKPDVELISEATITNPSPFLDTVSGLLDNLVTKAVNNTSNSPSLFATGSANYTNSDEVYGMVQCTPDLTPSICNTCLRSALARLSNCCFNTEGARVLYPSCTFRFEIYTFYGDNMYMNTTAPAPPPLRLPSTPLPLPPPTLQSPVNSTNSNGKDSSIVLAVSIAVPLGIALLLSFIAVWWFCFHKRKKINNKYSDPVKRTSLDWERRYKIIGGIARGLLYLHEDSRVRIIHRDLKTSNILVAEDMTPKISDFGMARLFLVDQTQANTMRIVGTYGYMAPEYALHGQFSVKSDVFSFGVLVLEIISGKKNTAFYESVAGGAQDLLTYAWKYWQKGLVMELLDSSLKENCSKSELMRCVHISLLCVQDNVADRPTMASIILMLDSNSVTLPLPTRPAYFVSDLAVEDACSLEVSVTAIDPR
ncbi:hypothetical protein MKX01_004393 [Papaver californicum]|nr:hypothetical protein MKX01_004393 [Papaver californicum]